LQDITSVHACMKLSTLTSLSLYIGKIPSWKLVVWFACSPSP